MIKKLFAVGIGLMLVGMVGCSTDEPETSAEKAQESLNKAAEASKKAASDVTAAAKEAGDEVVKAAKQERPSPGRSPTASETGSSPDVQPNSQSISDRESSLVFLPCLLE